MSLPKFTSPEDLQKKIDIYFESCYEDKYDDELGKTVKVNIRPITITGLAVALDTSRQTLLNYNDKDEYFDTIKKAKQKIENFAEEKLFGNNVAGVIFNMKNNWSWKDTQEIKSQNENINADISSLTVEEQKTRITELKRKFAELKETEK
jgi:hypothetical protein